MMGIGIIKRDGAFVDTPADALSALMDQHFPGSKESGVEDMATSVGRPIYEQAEDFVTEDRVRRSIASFGPKKAAGPDDLQPMVLQNFGDSTIKHLEQVFKAVLRTGYTPRAWRVMKVIFLPKPGKDDYGVAKAYRPITLSNFLLKALERIVQWYINANFVKTPLYAQHAYTTGLSTETALSSVVDRIEGAILRQSNALVVSLDCSGAFDTIDFNSAMAAMERKAIPRTVVRWYDNLLRGRCVTADLQGEFNNREPAMGSPQGGVLSPLVWNLIMDTLLTQFNGAAVRAVGYADDVILTVIGKDRSVMVDLMQQALDKVLAWGADNGLNFNPTKTVAVVFTKKMCPTAAWKTLKMDGRTIAYSDTLKYLGVTLSKQMSWTAHLKERNAKALKLMNWAKAVVGAKWGLTPERVLWVYTAMARPTITYGALVWAPTITQTAAKAFSKVQRLTLLGMSHAMRSTPTAGMEAALGLVPLDLFVEALATKARLRVRDLNKDTWDGIGTGKSKGHRRHWDDVLALSVPPNLPIDAVTRTQNWLVNKAVENPAVEIYTDGARAMEATGLGWVAYKDGEEVEHEAVSIGVDCTIFQAEMCAVTRGLMWLEEESEKTDIKNALVLTDSQSVAKAIYAGLVRTKTTLECVQTLQKNQPQDGRRDPLGQRTQRHRRKRTG